MNQKSDHIGTYEDDNMFNSFKPKYPLKEYIDGKSIIRESIKELMTEQSNDCLAVGFRTACSNQGSGMYQALHTQGYPGNSVFHFSDNNNQNVCHTINGQPITNANYQQYVGQLFTLDPSYGPSVGVPGTGISGNTNYFTGACDVFEIFNITWLGPYNMTVELNPASCGQGGCGSSTGTQVDGCMDSNAFNYDPNATNQPNLANICDYGWRCKEHWKQMPGLPGTCGPGDEQNPGDFQTKQDCIESDCEGKLADVEKDSDIDPLGPSGPISSPVSSKVSGGCQSDSDCEEDACCKDGFCEQCDRNKDSQTDIAINEKYLRNIIRETIKELNEKNFKPKSLNEECVKMIECAEGYTWVQSACKCLTDSERLDHVLDRMLDNWNTKGTLGVGKPNNNDIGYIDREF